MDKLQSSPVMQRFFAIIPYRHNRSTQRRICGAWAVVFLAFASLLLCFAAAVPGWAITRIDGQASLGPLSYSIDVIIGDGLWRRNQCWGDYNEELLRTIGYSCVSTPQLQGCDDFTKMSQEQVDNCDTMAWAQTVQLFAITCSMIAFWALLMSQWFARRVAGLLLGALFSFFAGYSASSVTVALQNSYMFKNMNYECPQVLLGVGEVCHGVGPSVGFQNLSIFMLFVGSTIAIVLAFTKHEDEDVSMIRAPLIVVSDADETVQDADLPQAVRIL